MPSQSRIFLLFHNVIIVSARPWLHSASYISSDFCSRLGNNIKFLSAASSNSWAPKCNFLRFFAKWKDHWTVVYPALCQETCMTELIVEVDHPKCANVIQQSKMERQGFTYLKHLFYETQCFKSPSHQTSNFFHNGNPVLLSRRPLMGFRGKAHHQSDYSKCVCV